MEKLKEKYILKHLQIRLPNKGGRSGGTITSPRRRNIRPRKLTQLDYNCTKRNMSVIMETNIRPNSGATAPISASVDSYGAYFLSTSAFKQKKGDIILTGYGRPKNIGDTDQLKHFGKGSIIHNISMHPNLKPIFIKAAGASAILIKRKKSFCLLKLRSGEYRYVYAKNYATMGSIGNKLKHLKHYEKAGAKAYKRRPRNRPSARNPVDHPLGGRTRGGYPSVDQKGNLSINRPTRRKLCDLVMYTKKQMKFRRF